MPLFPAPLPAPQMLVTDATDANNNGAGALTAGVAYFSSVSVLTTVTITKMRCQFSGAPTGNVDMGIFDATGANGGPGKNRGHTSHNTSATAGFQPEFTAQLTHSTRV